MCLLCVPFIPGSWADSFVFILGFFLCSLLTCISDSFHFLSASPHFPLYSSPLSCSLFLVLAASLTFSTFFSRRSRVGLRVGGRWLSVKGGKRPSKTKRGCLLAGQAGNANLPGLPPKWLLLDYHAGRQQIEADSPPEPLQHPDIRPSFPTFCFWDLGIFFSHFLSFFLYI